MNIDNLRVLAAGHPLQKRLDHLLRFLWDPLMYETKVDGTRVFSSIARDDIAQMMKDGTMRPLSKTQAKKVRRWAKFFTVYEAKKHRRRGIVWPRQVNDEVDYDCDIHLHSLLEQMLQMKSGDTAAAFDFTAGFHQFELGEEVRPYFSILTSDDEAYEFLRGLMGFRPMAELMDVTTKILATSTVLRKEHIDVRINTHIDNVRFLGTPDAVTRASQRFTENCAFVNATINSESQNELHRAGEYCGVVYDYEHGTTAVPSHMLDKLDAYYQEFCDSPTFETASAFFGVLFHVSAVLRAPLHAYYHVIKWYRKTMSRATTERITGAEGVRFWESARPQLEGWLRFVKANTPVTRNRTSATEIRLFTDASSTGWGALLFPGDGTMRVVAGRWSPLDASRDISEQEAMAVTNAVSAFMEWLRGAAFQLHVDNTSLLWAVAKGYARAWNLNKRVTELKAILDPLAATYSVHYVRSAENPADGPSRGFSPARITQLASPLGSRVGGLDGSLLPKRRSYSEVVRKNEKVRG